MKRRASIPKAGAGIPRKPETIRGGSLSRRLVFPGVVVALLGIAVLVVRLRRVPEPPRLDLDSVSPAVQRTVAGHLDEVRIQPRSAWAWGRLGSVLYAYRFKGPSLQALAEAERLDPENPRWPYLQAITLQYSDPARAEVLLRRTVSLVGSEPPAPRLRLARWLAEQGRWEEARPEIEALLTRKPVPAHALLMASQEASFRGEASRAAALAREAAGDPRCAKPALAWLASLLARQGDSDGASDAAQRARGAPGGDLFEDPFDAEALALREDPAALSEQVHPLMARGQLDAAGEVLERMLRDHPDYADTWLAAGRHAFLRKDYAKAEEHFRRHLELDAQSVQGWFQLGMVLQARQQPAEAADAFGHAVELKPDLAPAWHNRGLALGRLRRFEEALAAFRNVIRYSPEHLDAYLLSADLHLQRREFAAARGLLDRAAELKPDDRRIAALRQKLEQSSGAR